MKVVLLGSGNVATHLGKAFLNAGHTVLQVWSRNLEHATALSTVLKAEAIDDFKLLNTTADVYILSVVDDAIPDVVRAMPAVKGVVVHTSGSTSIDVLSCRFIHYGVFYPLQTFSKGVVVDLRSTPFLVEASTSDVLKIIRTLADSISENVQSCSSSQRIKIHIAAAFSCNFTNHLYSIAEEILSDIDIDFEVIRPLILETARKVTVNLPSQVQTGPAVRNDLRILDKHRAELDQYSEWRRIYDMLSTSIINKNS